MSKDAEDFDHHWDIKLPNGMNVTENKLNEALLRLGLDFKPQYKISKLTVDFAFPDKKIAIEVNGPHHDNMEYVMSDKRRYFFLTKSGWKVKTFAAEEVYNDPDSIAVRIKKLVLNEQSQEESDSDEGSEYQRLFNLIKEETGLSDEQINDKIERELKRLPGISKTLAVTLVARNKQIDYFEHAYTKASPKTNPVVVFFAVLLAFIILYVSFILFVRFIFHFG